MDVKELDELEKLNEFKKKGIITQEEFDKQKQLMLKAVSSETAKDKIKKNIQTIKYIAIPIAVLFVIFDIYKYMLLLYDQGIFLPSCDDEEVEKQVIAQLNNLPTMQVYRMFVSFESISMPEEVSLENFPLKERSYKGGLKVCRAQAKVRAQVRDADSKDIPIIYAYDSEEMFVQIINQ